MNRFRAWYRSRSGSSRPMILAHRGDSYHAPENTMEAARIGLEAGADGWELDVRLTADGHPVVIHDESLRRTTNVAERFVLDDRRRGGFQVDQFTRDEIQTLDAGSWFIDPESVEPRSARGFNTFAELEAEQLQRYGSGTVRVPTLDEAIGWTVDSGWLVNIEIKPTATDSDALVLAVLEVIEARNAWGFVTISSFDHGVVEAIARREPRVATGALISGPLDEQVQSWMETLKIDAVHGPAVCSTSMPARPLLIYTVNDSAEGGLASKLAEAGVTGIFTDDPSGLNRLFSLNRS